MPTAIEWTDETWNPLIGCSRCSPGCDHCYAIGAVHRELTPAHVGLTLRRPDAAERGPGERLDWTGEVRFVADRLDQPLRWTRPRRIFVNSLSDLFHEDVPVAQIVEVFSVMARARRHSFQVLTKRAKRMREVLRSVEFLEGLVARLDAEDDRLEWPLVNVWLGVSVESPNYWFRARYLADTPAMVRFLSVEPMLGPVVLGGGEWADIHWIIAGGESGPGARPMHPDWARGLRDQCQAQGIPFLFKQWGDWSPEPGSKPDPDAMVLLDGRAQVKGDWCEVADMVGAVPMARVGKKAAGRLLDGRTWDEYPA